MDIEEQDLTESSAYHGDGYQYRSSTKGGHYTGQIEVGFLRMVEQFPDGDPDNYQFLERPDTRRFNNQITEYHDRLAAHGVEVLYGGKTPHPNGSYCADVVLGIENQTLISRMASDVRGQEEPGVFHTLHDLGFDPVLPFLSRYEVSNIIPSPEGYLIGVGERASSSAAERIAGLLNTDTQLLEVSSEMQHLMGAVRPLPDGRAAVRPEHVDIDRVLNHFDGVIEFGETHEITHLEAMNITVADDTIFMPADTPQTQETFEESYDVETVEIDEIRKGAGGLACITGRIA